MGASLTASEHDLRTLAGIVSDQRSDLPDEGVPLSLLSDLKSQIPCDYVLFQGYDPRRNSYWFAQEVSGGGEDPYSASDEPSDQTFWEHFWNPSLSKLWLYNRAALSSNSQKLCSTLWQVILATAR